MAKVATKDIEDAYRGDDWSLRIQFWDNNVDPPVELDVSGRTYLAQVRESPDSPDATVININDDDAATGVIVLSLTDAQTALMAEENWWDLQETKISNGEVKTLIRGRFLVGRDITR